MTVTDEQIRRLREEAMAAGDYELVDICNRALAETPADQDGAPIAYEAQRIRSQLSELGGRPLWYVTDNGPFSLEGWVLGRAGQAVMLIVQAWHDGKCVEIYSNEDIPVQWEQLARWLRGEP